MIEFLFIAAMGVVGFIIGWKIGTYIADTIFNDNEDEDNG